MKPGALMMSLDAVDGYTREQCAELAYHVACELSIAVEVNFHDVETFTVQPPGAKRKGPNA